MECITVLKNPDFCSSDVEVSASDCKCKKIAKSGAGRLCSFDLPAVTSGLVLLVLALSLISQLFLWNDMVGVRDELKNVREQLETTEALVERLELELNYEKLKQSNTGGGQRKIRTVGSGLSIPHFYLKGNGKERHGENRFLWDGTGGIASSGAGPFAPADSGGRVNPLPAIQIGECGVYFIYIQIKVYGRRHPIGTANPAVGFSLKRNITETLTKAILTQDEKGYRYNHGGQVWPVDTLTLSGIFFLKREDRLSVTPLSDQINDHHIEWVNEADASHFGGFMLEHSNWC